MEEEKKGKLGIPEGKDGDNHGGRESEAYIWQNLQAQVTCATSDEAIWPKSLSDTGECRLLFYILGKLFSTYPRQDND
ncbi:unnamed protein product [Caretta caretta]